MKAASLLFASAILTTVAFADDHKSPVTTDFQIGAFNKYVWRGINVVDDFVLQPSLTFGYQKWSLNFWGNYETTNANTYPSGSTGKNRFTEWDTTLNYSQDMAWGGLDLGLIYYDFPTTGGAATTELFVTATGNSRSFAGEAWSISPYASVFFDIDEADGFYSKFGATAETAVGEGDTVAVGAWFGYSDKKYNNYYYGNNKSAFADYGLDAKYTKNFSEKSFGYINLAFTGLLDKGHRNGLPNRSNVVFGFGYGMSF